MASSSISSTSTAVVPYDPTLPHISVRAHLEKVTDEAYRRSFEIAKCEASYFPQVTSNFTGRNFVCLSSAHLTPPKGLKTDSAIDIEIFSAKPGNHKPPILIFSHGYTTPPVKYRPLLGELASHGYTVLSLNHSSIIEEVPSLTREQETALMEELAPVMANNIQYVLEKVRNGVLKGMGDPNKIVLGGHSLGGAASIMVSRTDPTIAGCVNLDGFLKGNRKTDGLEQPLLIMTGDYQSGIEEDEQDPEKEVRDNAKFMSQSLEEYETLHTNTNDSSHSEKITIDRGRHMDFTDEPFRDYLAGEKTLDAAMRVHTIVSQKMLGFMHSVCGAR